MAFDCIKGNRKGGARSFLLRREQEEGDADDQVDR